MPSSVDLITLSAKLEVSPNTYGVFIPDIVEDVRRTILCKVFMLLVVRAAGRRAEIRVVALAPYFWRFRHDSNRRRTVACSWHSEPLTL